MNDYFDLRNKTILITGGSSGIGQKTAIDLSKLGANCIVHGRKTEHIHSTLKSCVNPDEHLSMQLDLLDFEKYDETLKSLPQLDGVVHCAGIQPKLVPLKFMKLEFLRELQDVNLNSIIILLSKLWRYNKLNNNGSIVLMSSISSLYGVVGTLAYAVSKGGLNSATKILAHEFAAKRIRVNSIAAGMVQTPMQKNISANMDEQSLSKDIERYPFGYGEPTDISDLIVFLLSSHSKWLTGSVYPADGGYSIK